MNAYAYYAFYKNTHTIHNKLCIHCNNVQILLLIVTLYHIMIIIGDLFLLPRIPINISETNMVN